MMDIDRPSAKEARAMGLARGHLWSDGYRWSGRRWDSVEAWERERQKKAERRRIGTGFPHGYVREDGMVSDGKSWCTPEAWARAKDRKRNKRTGFPRGYVREDGKVSDGNSWLTPESWERQVARSRIDGMSMRVRVRRLIEYARMRAKKKGIPFDLTVNDILPRIERGVCEITGIPFEFGRKAGYSRNPYAPSLDRIDCKGGYTKNNVLVVVVHFNLGRREMSIHEYIAFCAHVATRCSDRAHAA